ncbi:MAG TPA: DUF6491 family protein [Allosphingosinicella sp.]|jgi:hypothetical protein
MSLLLAAALGLALQPAGAATPAAPDAQETAVPDAGRDGILEWKADGDRALYLRSLTGGWYYARTANRCSRLNSASSLRFLTRGSRDLDRYGAVIAEGWRCPLVSVTRSGPPPREPRS